MNSLPSTYSAVSVQEGSGALKMRGLVSISRTCNAHSWILPLYCSMVLLSLMILDTIDVIGGYDFSVYHYVEMNWLLCRICWKSS